MNEGAAGGRSLFVQNGRYVSIEELNDDEAILRAIAVHPDLIGKVTRQTLAMKWLTVLREPATLSAIVKPDHMMQAAAAMLDPFSVNILDVVPQQVADITQGLGRGSIENEPFRLKTLATKNAVSL